MDRLAHRVLRRWAARAIPIDDREVEKLTRTILARLSTNLKHLDQDAPIQQSSSRWGFDLDDQFRTTNVRGFPVEVTVRVDAAELHERGRDYVAGGAARGYYETDAHGKANGTKFFTHLVVHINSERTPRELLDNLQGKLHQEISSVLRHEVTHLKDIIPPKSEVDYHNDPAEIRAFLRQISDEVVAYAHAQGEDDPFFIQVLDSRFIDHALESSATWDRIRRDLTSKNEKLVLQAATRALQDEWPKLQKLYPMDEDL